MCVGEGANIRGEEYKKEGEEIVFCVVVVQKQESGREKHSVFFATHHPGARLPGLPLTTTRELFTGHRQLGRWSGLGRAAGGGACK